MESAKPRFQGDNHDIKRADTSYEKYKVTSALWKEVTADSKLDLPVDDNEAWISSFCGDPAVDPSPVLQPCAFWNENLLSVRANNNTSGNKSLKKHKKQSAFVSPADNAHENSFDKSTPYKVVKSLNMSCDSDKTEDFPLYANSNYSSHFGEVMKSANFSAHVANDGSGHQISTGPENYWGNFQSFRAPTSESSSPALRTSHVPQSAGATSACHPSSFSPTQDESPLNNNAREVKLFPPSYYSATCSLSSSSIEEVMEPANISTPISNENSGFQKSAAFKKFWQNFWDINIAASEVPSPIPMPLNRAQDDKVTDQECSHLNELEVGASRTFPTTPPPVHVSSFNSPMHKTSVECQEHPNYELHQWAEDYSYSQGIPSSHLSAHTAQRVDGHHARPKTDLVALMQELAVTFGNDQEELRMNENVMEAGTSKRNDFCVFCKKNNYHETFFRSHTLKNRYGHCQCPVLRHYVCPLCKATGDFAHTLKYCPKNVVTHGDPITAGLPPGKVTNWRQMAMVLDSRRKGF